MMHWSMPWYRLVLDALISAKLIVVYWHKNAVGAQSLFWDAPPHNSVIGVKHHEVALVANHQAAGFHRRHADRGPIRISMHGSHVHNAFPPHLQMFSTLAVHVRWKSPDSLANIRYLVRLHVAAAEVEDDVRICLVLQPEAAVGAADATIDSQDLPSEQHKRRIKRGTQRRSTEQACKAAVHCAGAHLAYEWQHVQQAGQHLVRESIKAERRRGRLHDAAYTRLRRRAHTMSPSIDTVT